MERGSGWSGERKAIWKERVGCLCRRSGAKIPLPSPVTSHQLPPTPSPRSSPFSSPPPIPTQHLSPHHLQRWSGGSGSRGNASCKASHGVQRREGACLQHRLGHAVRGLPHKLTPTPRSFFLQPHPHVPPSVPSPSPRPEAPSKGGRGRP